MFEKDTLKKVIEILTKLASEGAKVEITFQREDMRYKQKFSFEGKQILILPVILKHLIVKIKNSLGDHTHLKVHIKKTNMTVIHRNVPISFSDKIIITLLYCILKY